MSRKLTVGEAWGHLSALFDDAYALSRDEYGNVSLHRESTWSVQLGDCVDWPDGVDRWSPLEREKPRRSAVMPEDYGKRAWFRDSRGGSWDVGVLCGFIVNLQLWVDEEGYKWRFAEVECDG